MKAVKSMLLCLLALCLLPLAACQKAERALPAGTVYAGEHIALTREDLDRQQAWGEAVNPDYTPEQALHDVTLQAALAWKAEEAGLPDADEGYFAYLEQYQADFQNADNPEDVTRIWRKAYGKTPEEYFTWAKTDAFLRRTWYGETFVSALKEQFQNGEAPRVNVTPLPENWGEYFSAYQEQLIQTEHVQKVS